jgi:hypothetical protein
MLLERAVELEYRPLMLAELRCGGSDGADQGAPVPALWPVHGPQGYPTGVVAGPVWKAQRAGFAFRLSSLPCAVQAFAFDSAYNVLEVIKCPIPSNTLSS